MNDLTTVLSQGEADLLLVAQVGAGADSSIPPLISIFYKFWYDWTGLQLFWYRLPSVLLLLGSCGLFYFFGQRLFGKYLIGATSLVFMSSWLIGNTAKFAVSDNWLFAIQLINGLSLLYFVKKASPAWDRVFWITLLLGAAIAPIQMGLYSGIWWLWLKFRHPKGHQLSNPYLWLLYLPLPLLSNQLGTPLLSDQSSFFNQSFFAYKGYFIALGIGLIPWLGFLPATLVDTFKKWRRSEEMAIILVGWLLASLVAKSMVIMLVFSLLIARQLTAYLLDRYPYKNLVKGGVVLLIILLFCAITVGMINSFYGLQALGYRSAMAVGASFWIFSFLGVLGLYAKSRSMIHGGFGMAGVLFSVLFWTQCNPIIEQSRSAPRQIVSMMESIPDLRAGTELVWSVDGLARDNVFQVYQNASYKASQVDVLEVGPPKPAVTGGLPSYKLTEKPLGKEEEATQDNPLIVRARKKLLGEEMYLLIEPVLLLEEEEQ
ncbi:MAG: hypothetical protein AAF990_11910 [Bacteroidota bacterium]